MHSLILAVFLSILFQPTFSQTPSGFEPSTSNPLVIELGSSIVSPNGESLTAAVVANAPSLGTSTRLNGTYLAIMVDPDAGTATDTIEVFHWLQTGLKSKPNNGIGLFPLSSSHKPLASYLSPAPPPGNVHQYTITLWKQQDDFMVPAAFVPFFPLNIQNITNRYPFSLTTFVQQANLATPVAGGYFELQNRTGSMSATTTSSTGNTSGGASSTPTAATTAKSSAASFIGAGSYCMDRASLSGCFGWAMLAIVALIAGT